MTTTAPRVGKERTYDYDLIQQLSRENPGLSGAGIAKLYTERTKQDILPQRVYNILSKLKTAQDRGGRPRAYKRRVVVSEPAGEPVEVETTSHAPAESPSHTNAVQISKEVEAIRAIHTIMMMLGEKDRRHVAKWVATRFLNPEG